MAFEIHPDLIKPFEVGRTLRASELNTFLRSTKRNSQVKHGFSSIDGTIQGNIPFSFDELLIKNSLAEEVQPYSLFTIGSPGLDFSWIEPITDLKKFQTNDKLILTNGTDPFQIGVNSRAELIGRHRIYLLRYDPASGVPEAGDEMGLVEDSLFLHKDQIGFVALCKGNTDEDLVWACAVSIGTALNMEMGKLNNPLPPYPDPGCVGPLTLWQQTGLTGATVSLLTTLEEIQVLNVTTTELQTNVLHQVRYNKRFALPLVFPHEIDECFQPELNPQTTGLNPTASVTINPRSRLWFDPAATGSPRTIVFPESTLLPEGSKVGIQVVNNDSTAVTLQANSGSASDKIMNPIVRTDAPASTISGLNLQLHSDEWVLIKTGQINPLWYNSTP